MGNTVNVKTVEKKILTNVISGYLGYELPEHREGTDSNFRTFLTAQLTTIVEQLVSAGKKQPKNANGGQPEITPQVIMSLKTIVRSLQEPCNSYHNFYVKKSVNQKTLTRLYDYDSQLYDQVSILADESLLFSERSTETDNGEALHHLYDLIDGINQILTEREFIILEES